MWKCNVVIIRLYFTAMGSLKASLICNYYLNDLFSVIVSLSRMDS